MEVHNIFNWIKFNHIWTYLKRNRGTSSSISMKTLQSIYKIQTRRVLYTSTSNSFYITIITLLTLSHHKISSKLTLCRFSWIYQLGIGEIRGKLEVLHGVDDHDFVHLVHDEPLVENLMRGLLPAYLMLEMPHVYCVQEMLYL